MSFKLPTDDGDRLTECDNCGSEEHMYSNSSGEIWCESCGWQESD